MTNDPDQTKILSEIRDLLHSREAKYDQYLQQAREQYSKQVAAANNNRWLYLIWICFAVTIGVFFGGLMLRGIGER